MFKDLFKLAFSLIKPGVPQLLLILGQSHNLFEWCVIFTCVLWQETVQRWQLLLLFFAISWRRNQSSTNLKMHICLDIYDRNDLHACNISQSTYAGYSRKGFYTLYRTAQAFECQWWHKWLSLLIRGAHTFFVWKLLIKWPSRNYVCTSKNLLSILYLYNIYIKCITLWSHIAQFKSISSQCRIFYKQSLSHLPTSK